jgi:flagellar biosynthesis protein FlhB
MAENEDGQEKKHDATGQKLDQAAKKGNFAKSQDINSLAVLGAGSFSLMFGMPYISAPVLQYSSDVFDVSGKQTLDMAQIIDLGGKSIQACAYALLVPMAMIVLAGICAGLLQSWGRLATEALEFNASKLNPVSGFKQTYMSWMPLVELGKGIGKFVLLGAICTWALWGRLDEIPMMATYEPIVLVGVMGDLIFTMVLAALPIIFILAIADYSYQKWKNSEDLKMTDQEIKDQAKQQEGDPQMKAMRKQRAREIAMGQMMSTLPEADVVVTNPTHYAVALRYTRGKDAAPVVLAKGIDFLALKIRAECRNLGIPQVEDRPLARALHAKAEVNHPIPDDLFGPVAKVLAIIYRRQARRRQAMGL